LSFIDERLNELDQEKQELAEYEQLDKQRRALEYNLYDKEFIKAQHQLEEIEREREEFRTQQETLRADLRDIQGDVSAIEDNLANLKATVERLETRKQSKTEDLTKTSQRKAEMEEEIRDLERSIAQRERALADSTKQLEAVLQQLNETEHLLHNKIEPEYQEKQRAVVQISNQLQQMKARTEALYGKQGRGSQFKTVADRNKFLTTQISKLSAQIQKKEESSVQITESITANETRIEQEKSNLTVLEQEHQSISNRFDAVTKQTSELVNHRNGLQERRKNNWRELERIQEELHLSKQELDKSKQQLNRTLPPHISQGLAAIEQIVREKRIKGYFGPLIDNISLKSDALRNAVEVAAGPALFHCIVDDDRTAATLIHELEKRNAGRLTFLPLNRLRVPKVAYPESNDVRPMIQVAINYDPEVEAAIKLVFGQKLLARDLEIAVHYSKECKMDAITMDGDLVNHKGAFEGGYHDERQSKIAAVESIRQSSQKISDLIKEEESLKKLSDTAEQDILDSINQLSKLENEKNHCKLSLDRQKKDMANLKKLISQLQQSIYDLQANRESVQQELSNVQITQSNYQNEMSQPLLQNLSEDERQELFGLEEATKRETARLDQLKNEMTEVSSAREELHAKLQNHLYKRKDDIELFLSQNQGVSEEMEANEPAVSAVAEEVEEVQQPTRSGRGRGAKAAASKKSAATSSSAAAPSGSVEKVGKFRDYQAELENRQLELHSLATMLVTLEADVKEISLLLLGKNQEIARLEEEYDGLKDQEKELSDGLSEVTTTLDKVYNKRSMVLEVIQTRNSSLRDLGTLPQRLIEEYHHLAEKQIITQLKQVNEKLKKFANVNRKALDQYLSFNEQREILIQRKEEMNRDTAAIEQLIQSLDIQKDETILNTFRSVSQHFADVFKELVPNGYGKLVMKTALDPTDGGEDEAEGDKGETGEKEKSSSKKTKGKDTATAQSTVKIGTSDRVLNEEDEESKAAKSSSSRSSGPNFGIETFKGIQVIVSFNAASGEQYSMQQLSGGQKALVALALIFAIQRCDPAPFYLFDEIDQALDTNYRIAVANLIQRQANSETAPAQFITTTFRPEMVNVADKCFGIALMNKVSNIYAMKKVK
jgi:structural maintenance of chromosome 3 (chondroitin sulfate proteoglycan 6)